MTATDLILGQEAIVDSFADESLGECLLERGVVPGDRLTVERVAPFGDPIAIRVSDHLLCIRKKEASTIIVHTEETRP